jgi:hypothetical protein
MASMRSAAVIACAICGVVAMGLAVLTSMTVSMYGFPDSHVTDYEEAASGPLTILGWVQAGLGLLFLALAFSPIGARARTASWLVALVALAVVTVVAQIGVPWYFGTHLGLDNGIGG